MRRLLPVGLAFLLFMGCGGGGGPGGAGGGQESSGGVSGENGGGGAAGGSNGTGGATSAGGGTPTGGASTGSGGASSAGGSSGTAANSVQVIVDQGPQNIGYTNGLFVTVTLCVPGTSTCQTIDHVLVDTGSCGLRVLETVLTLSLPALKDSTGATLASCSQFVDGTAWGPIAKADVKIGGESASAIPIQTIGEKTYPMPTTGTCSSGTPINDFQTLAANGIVGVGIYQQDCGAACAQASRNPGMYFACTSSQAGACKTTVVPLDSQVRNPILGFPVDNNGLMIQLPSLPAKGLPSATGKLVFGIGTQSNNGLGSATVITPVDVYGNIGTTFPVGGANYTGFVDSGTNAYSFLDPTTSGLAMCTVAGVDSFYCPAVTTGLSATIFGANRASALVNFSIANASKLTSTSFAISDIGGPMPGFPVMAAGVPDFLWGLPFFYGRNVYTAIEKQSTPGGQGPYVAF